MERICGKGVWDGNVEVEMLFFEDLPFSLRDVLLGISTWQFVQPQS